MKPAHEEEAGCHAVGDDNDILREILLQEAAEERPEEVTDAVVDICSGLSVRNTVVEGAIGVPLPVNGCPFC